MVNNFFDQLISLCLPNYCILCQASSEDTLNLCLHCRKALPELSQPYCSQCAHPLNSDKASFCARCLKESPAYQQTVAGWLYQFPIDYLINELKNQQRLSHAKVFSQLLTPKIQQHYQDQPLPDIIIPTPLHWRRLWQRGFNQSDELVRYLSHRFNIPIQRCLKRIRYTEKQQGLNAKQRRHNLHSAFAVPHQQAIQGKIIALVDDVVTTGTTVQLMSECLLTAGAKEIHIWCIARTPIHP